MSEQSLSNAGADEATRLGTGTRYEGSGDPREGVSTLASDAGDAGRQVADVAKEETRSVASETKQQARQFLGKVGEELRGQAATQQSRVAEGLQSVGSEFTDMASNSTRSGYAAELVRGAGERVDAAATWLGDRDPQSLLEEVKGFARRRPGVFIAIAIGAGLLAGRLTRAIAQPSDDTGGTTDTARSTRSTGATRTAVPGVSSDDAGYTAPPVPPVPEATPPRTTTVGTGGVSTDRTFGGV